MELVSQIADSTFNGLGYVGSLASLGAQAAYYTLVGPFQGKPVSLKRAISQAMEVGVRALPILSLITFFIGVILALQSAYELRRFGAMSAPIAATRTGAATMRGAARLSAVMPPAPGGA